MTCTVTCRECGESLVLKGAMARENVQVFIALVEQKGWKLDKRSFWRCPKHGVNSEKEKA